MFDGGDLAAYADVRAAENDTEIFDIDSLQFVRADGTLLRATARGYAVHLEPTNQRDEEALKERLRAFLSHPKVGMDPGLADDPARAAAALMLLPPGRRRWRRR